jgi:hypothetical protein
MERAKSMAPYMYDTKQIGEGPSEYCDALNLG